jgi:hypothetical protein
MYQELGYLRDELNMRVNNQSAHANKTINMVLLIWGGALVILGKDGVKLSGVCVESILLCFTVATIFFISSMVLYYTAQKNFNHRHNMFKISAYIAVFYERWPGKAAKIGENFSWELVNSKIEAHGLEGKNFYKWNFEYKALAIVSIALISLIFLALLYFSIFAKSCDVRAVGIITLVICAIYLVFSAYWLREIPKFTYSMGGNEIKIQYMDTFIQLALDTEHDTQETLKERLGDVWDIVNAYLVNNKSKK